MAENNEVKIEEKQQQEEEQDLFKWDENSQLYYHASSGFYHDPAAGWYYNSNDGLYYKFKNGSYMLWDTGQADQSNTNERIVSVDDNCTHDEPHTHASCDKEKIEDGEFEGYVAVSEEVIPHEPIADTESLTNDLPESVPPPSEWLEDTLIELYLSGYPNQTTDGASAARTPEDDTSLSIPIDGVGNDNDDELEEGEWIPDETHEVVASDEDAFAEEEMWRAQYGQAIHLDKFPVSDYPVVDLWDWEMVKETRKGRKRRIRRLIGRLVKRSSKLHPSVPASGRVLKTAPIREVHLDLVRVRSGKVYKLRNPKTSYIASLSSYDSSNPTKGWGFPELSMEKKVSQHNEPKREEDYVEEVESEKVLSFSEKHKDHTYRDRAAERRILHGGFGVGPGQKKSVDEVDSGSSSPVSPNPEEAAAEALQISFGVGSYARRMLENMGWKEGEALGSSMKGLTEPLQAVGNKGGSGLGWNHKSNWNRI
uniref:angiogenic factor with G patch and FHA domains 1 n=1 Tax=Erigeron canadensis TaxID=72917 RepID=UPI001CB96625|nr:angiogenic factor with G patch and FHA domains 1 [Erigeron canadensis]